MLLINCDGAPALNPGWSVRTARIFQRESSPHHTVKSLPQLLLNHTFISERCVIQRETIVWSSSRVSSVCQMVTGDGQPEPPVRECRVMYSS